MVCIITDADFVLLMKFIELIGIVSPATTSFNIEWRRMTCVGRTGAASLAIPLSETSKMNEN